MADNNDGKLTVTAPQTAGTYEFSVTYKAELNYTDNSALQAPTTTVYYKLVVDGTAPNISITTPADGAEYDTDEEVFADFECTDESGGSGIQSCTGTVADGIALDTATAGAKTFTVNAVDKAGNTSKLTHDYTVVDPDTVAPITTASATNADDSTYTSDTWTNQNVEVTLNASDNTGGSGVKETFYRIGGSGDYTLYSAPFTVSSQGSHTISYYSTDNANNIETAQTFTVKIDKTAPAITPNGFDGGTTWYKADVTKSFTASDSGGSGLATGQGLDADNAFSLTASGESTKNSDGTFNKVESGTKTISDVAGNSTISGKVSVLIDKTNPTTPTFNNGPANGSSHDFGTAPAYPTCDSSDALSGLASCTVTDKVNSATTTNPNALGTHTLTATATDNAGNTQTATRTYEVKAARASGFYQPVDMGDILNTVKSGSTVPVKFELFGGATNTEQKTIGAVETITASKVSCGAFTGDPVDAIEYLAPTSENTGLRFDTTGDQFIYNWKTPAKAANTCYSLTMTAKDGQTKLVAYFQLK